MAGFRTFATGEVLTAANVNNFLMKQSVMVFADADARTAALGADVVEGMLTYNLATDQLEVFDGTNFVVAAPEPPAGIGSNVVQTVKTNAFTSTAATGFDDVTGLTATITPSEATSKVLVVAQVSASADAGDNFFLRLSGGNATDYVGDADEARGRAIASVRGDSGSYEPRLNLLAYSLIFLDSPNTTSPVTYSVQFSRPAGTVFINRTATDSNFGSVPRGASSITVIEVAA